jgi:PAS domain S-box-containing protein
MDTPITTDQALLLEIAGLRTRLEEAEETLRAIRSGEVDALVVESPSGPQVYSLQSADAESNRFRGDILTQINDVVIATDLEQRITYFNAAAERQYCIGSGDVLGCKIDEVYTKHWPSAEAEAAVWSALLERGEWQGEAVHRTFDGRELYVEANVSILGHDGEPNGLLAVIRDITGRKRTEKLLEESQQRYAGIIQSAMDAVITVDHNYTVLVFNPAAELMFGCPADEAIGGSLERFIPEKFRQDHDLHIRAFGRTANANRKMGSVGRVTGLRTNGKEFPIEVSISQSGTEGAKLFTAILRDISERVHAETILKEQLRLQDQFTKIAASVPGLICSFRLDQDGSVSMPYASPTIESLYGMTHEAVAEDFSPVFARFHADDISQINKTIADSARKLQPWRAIWRYNHPWKGEIWLEGHSMPQREPDGSILWHGYIHDITSRKLAEIALQERENELQLIMNAAPALISYLDTDFRYLRVNKTYENWFCLHQEQILGHSAREILGEKAWSMVSLYLERARSGERVSFDYQIPYGTGKPRWVHGNYIPDKDGNGNVKGVVVHVTDIDDRKQAELERQKFVSLANNSQEFIGMCDMKFMPFYANPAGIKLVGLDSLEQALKTPVQEFFFPEDQAFILEEFFPRVIREKSGEVEIRFRHFKTGVALWMIYNVFFITNDQGEPVGLATVSQDITARKLAELALEESERQNRFLADILEHAGQPFAVGFPDGRLEYVNPAFERLTGFSHDELLAMDWATKLTPPEWKAIEQAKLEELQHNQQAIRYEKEYYRKDGTRVPIELLVEMVSDEAGRPLHYYAFITDLTERKQAEAALRESEERMRLATETTGVGIWEWNVITNQVRWDAQMFRIYGIAPTRDGFVDFTTWSATVLPEDLPYQEEVLQNTARQGGRSAREFRIRRSGDKEIRYIHAVETARLNDSGAIEWVVGTNLDNTDLMHATQALQASEERLALGVQVAGLALAEVDYNSGLNYLSAQAAQLFGLGDAEIVVPREAVHATFHPDDRAELLRLIDECISPSGNGWFDMSHRVMLPNGTVRWLHVRKQVTFTGEGKARRPIKATLALHDITAEKQAIEVVLTSEMFVRSVLNSLPEHVVVLDANGEITAVNEPWERFASENDGTPHAVSKGANYLEICRSSSAAGDRYAHQALIGLEDLFANRRQEFVMEYPCPTPRLNRWFLMQAKRTNQGIDGIILSHVDITERKRTEDELRNAQARLALVIEEVNAGYWDWDLKTNKLYLSPEWSRQLGLDEEESLLQWDRKNDRLHPDDRPMVTVATENYIAGRQPNLELQFRLRHKDGSYRWIHSRGALLRDEDKQPIRLLGLNLDITDYIKDKELSKGRDEMEKSFRLYVASQTAAAIAHELNQPLTAISYYAYVMKDMLTSSTPNPQKLVKVMEKCGVQAQRAGDVIKQLTSLLHKGETNIEPLNINQSVNFACDLVKSNGYHDKIQIKLNLTDDLPLVTSNALQIQKVLVNLINNALESMYESGIQEGTVTVTTCRHPEAPTMAQVTVCDSGKGATDSDVLSKMFQPFYTTKPKGLGMGLAISRALVVAHGGKMWAESNADRGISVHFTLPFVS